MRVVAAVLICIVPICAQTRRPAAKRPAASPAKTVAAEQSWPIGQLSVEGNRTLPSDRILDVAGLRVGQKAGKAEFEAARDRLTATGLFETVGYRFEPASSGAKTFAASFQVVEIPQFFAYRFEALDVDRKAFEAFVRTKEPLLGEQIPGTQPVLNRMARYAEEFLKLKGTNVAILGKLVSDSPGSLVAVFLPNSLPAVAEVEFKGNRLLTTNELQQTVVGAAVGSLYTENRFRQILDASLRPLYESKGRLRVAFPGLQTTPAKSVKGLSVTVTVQEGPEYKLRNTSVTGTLSQDQRLLKEGNFHTDEVVNYSQVQAGVEQITQALRRDGYLLAKAAAERTIDETAKAVDVIVRVHPGAQFKMGKLNIEGLDIETEPAIRKLWAMKAGQPFNVEYPNFFLARLRSDELFDNLGKTQSAVQPDETAHVVDVTLKISGDNKPRPRIGPQDPKQRRQQEPNPQGPPF